MPKGWGAPGTAELIRDHLLEVGSDCVYGCWVAVKEKIEPRYVPPSYLSTASMFWALRKLGLVQKLGEERSRTRGRIAKTIYRVAPGREKDIAWQNPILAARDPERFKETRGFRPDEFIARTLPRLMEGAERRRAQP